MTISVQGKEGSARRKISLTRYMKAISRMIRRMEREQSYTDTQEKLSRLSLEMT
jgi:hypothetical protein